MIFVNLTAHHAFSEDCENSRKFVDMRWQRPAGQVLGRCDDVPVWGEGGQAGPGGGAVQSGDGVIKLCICTGNST